MGSFTAFLKHSYHSDPTSFVLEFISLVFTVVASLTLAVTAQEPNMVIVYPGFFIGSITATIAYFRRKLVWPMILTCYFAVINVVGFFVALG